jgi:protein gp37
MAESDIEWTEATWNPLAGCTMVSPGCTNCYAMRMAARLERMGQAKYAGTTRKSGGRDVWTGRVNLDERALIAPLNWRKPTVVFVNSMSDLFHESVALETVRRVWDVMAQTPQHTYQILTKRAGRMYAFARHLPVLPNVWLGVTVESEETADRLDVLRATPAEVRFVSFEPLIGRVHGPDLRRISWAIVGGESGPGARPMDVAWVDELLSACRAHGTAFFFKQWGGTNKKRTGRVLHGRTWDEYPQKPLLVAGI